MTEREVREMWIIGGGLGLLGALMAMRKRRQMGAVALSKKDYRKAIKFICGKGMKHPACKSKAAMERYIQKNYGKKLPQQLGGFSSLGLNDEAHGKEVIRLAEQANENLTEMEQALKARRSKKSCRLAFNKLRAAYTPIIAAKEQAGSVESGRAKYDELVNNMATDYTQLQEQLTKRCGRVERDFRYKWGRKCIQWYKRKKKGRRICKKYKRIRRR